MTNNQEKDKELSLMLEVFLWAFTYIIDYERINETHMFISRAIWEKYITARLAGKNIDLYGLIEKTVSFELEAKSEHYKRAISIIQAGCAKINITWAKFSGGLFNKYPAVILDSINAHFNDKYRNLSNTVKLYVMKIILGKMGFSNTIEVRFVYANTSIKLGQQYVIKRCVIPEFYIKFTEFNYFAYAGYNNLVDDATEEEFNECYAFIRDYLQVNQISIEHSNSCEFSRLNFSAYNKILMMKNKPSKPKKQKRKAKDLKCTCHVAKYMDLFAFICEIESSGYQFNCEVSSLGAEYLLDACPLTLSTDVYGGKCWFSICSIIDEIGADVSKSAINLLDSSAKPAKKNKRVSH